MEFCWKRTNETEDVIMKNKVLKYVANCWDSYRCADKRDVERIINEVIAENPGETSYVKLGMLAKRRCIGELK